ncbi:MAG TPA: anaerobic sulfatase maturase [Solirubrobacteraceae bacterium]|nr:anaerobic sulfatase maturase [Solirubrobacteraceae bacterium]
MEIDTDVEAAGPVLTVHGAPLAFHLMAKPTGAICNLDCEYCFFLSKEMLYPGSRFRMAQELQESYIRQLLEAHDRAPEVVVAWQGGEPTIMGLDFFRRSIELQREYARPGQRILNTLQTNGTLFNDEWGEFLKENEFLVGISIDGPREIHDTYRVSKGGKPTFERVIRGLDVLKRHGVEWNVLTTLHAANGDHGRRVYRFLRDELGAEFVQFIPIIERATPETLEVADSGWGGRVKGRPLYTQQGELVTRRSIGPEQYGRFMIDVFEEWVRHDIGRVYVQMFDTALANFHGEPSGMCVHAETCGLQLALEHNGDLYCCDHFVEPHYLLGNIAETPMQQLITSSKQVKFGQDKRDTLTQYCLDCDVRFACNGGCPKDRFATSPYGESGQHYLCPGYKLFFHHVQEPMRAMAELLAVGRAPAELMDVYARQDARRGRNEPCSCGSDRKWKHCHGAGAIA